VKQKTRLRFWAALIFVMPLFLIYEKLRVINQWARLERKSKKGKITGLK
jgi:hypothetical protein